MAPIDPKELLRALDSLLSPTGGIKSIGDVQRLASLMKKFSKKLVSRCVYCNVLQSTEQPILSEFLDKGGWQTINVWMEYAKSASSPCFLIEMLHLCKLLPMTVSRLKENNTAKLIKSFTKHDNSEVKTLSNEVVTKWMTIIKHQKCAEVATVTEKKKKEKTKAKPEKKKEVKEPSPESQSPKVPAKLKGVKRLSSERQAEMRRLSSEREAGARRLSSEREVRTRRPSSEKVALKRLSSAKEAKKEEFFEDVTIDPEPLMPVSKKPKTDRPKTAKIYQKKFRATGLEEETPLPKKIAKKVPTVDKTAAVAAAKNALKIHTTLPERITEKKLKPETLAAVNENAPKKGIQLINAKPRPIYQIHESAGFMDALISQPAAPIKRKKKVANKVPPSPTSPTLAAPKLQFYKDTLEMNEEKPKKEESEKENVSADQEKPESPTEQPMAVVSNEEGGNTPPNEEAANPPSPDKEKTEEPMDVTPEEPAEPLDPNQLRSILSHGRRRGQKKKSVKWVADEDMQEVFYFEMDETERVNVLKAQNFGDLKSIELKREREAMEIVRRQTGDKMEETTSWWLVPILIDIPPAIVEPGHQSTEKHTEALRQQSTLQEIYFTREMVPDSPHEPDLEIVPPQEPKVIPLDEDNQIGQLLDYSNYEIPSRNIIPDSVLSNLMKLNSLMLPFQNTVPNQMAIDPNLVNPQMMNVDVMGHPNGPMQMAAPYDPAEPLPPMQQPNSLMGIHPTMQQPNMYGMVGTPPVQEVPPQNMVNPGEWHTPEMVHDQYFGGAGGFQPHPGAPPNMRPEAPGMNMNMRPPIMNPNFRPNMKKGPPRIGIRHRGPPTVPCRHFLTGNCRFEMKCTFLHPGINGPRLL